MVIFGTIGIFVRYIPLPSSFIAVMRGFVGALFVLLFLFLKKSSPDKKAISKNLRMLVLSDAFIGINWILLFEAYHYTTVATATLCYYMQPIFVILPLRPSFWLCCCLWASSIRGWLMFCILHL